MGRKQFTFYRSFYEAILKIPEEKRWQVMEAVIRFALNLEEPEGLDDEQLMYFILAKPTLEASWRKAISGTIGGKNGHRGPAKKISKGEIENENEIELEIELETETETETEGFRAFWERYPVKVGRAAAWEAWECVCLNERDILSGLEDWILSKQWSMEGGRFIPKPEKFLEEGWWQQKPASVGVPYGASGRLGQAELQAIDKLFKEDK